MTRIDELIATHLEQYREGDDFSTLSVAALIGQTGPLGEWKQHADFPWTGPVDVVNVPPKRVECRWPAGNQVENINKFYVQLAATTTTFGITFNCVDTDDGPAIFGFYDASGMPGTPIGAGPRFLLTSGTTLKYGAGVDTGLSVVKNTVHELEYEWLGATAGRCRLDGSAWVNMTFDASTEPEIIYFTGTQSQICNYDLHAVSISRLGLFPTDPDVPGHAHVTLVETGPVIDDGVVRERCYIDYIGDRDVPWTVLKVLQSLDVPAVVASIVRQTKAYSSTGEWWTRIEVNVQR